MPDVIMGWVKVDREEAKWPKKVLWEIRDVIREPQTLPSPNNTIVVFSFNPRDLVTVKKYLTSPEFVEDFGVYTNYLGGSGIYSLSGGTCHSWPEEL